MNEPLRYRGETFYQADFDKKTETQTILQVVRNPGWLLPYISCFLVTLGMMTHFGITLVNFLRRRARAMTLRSAVAGRRGRARVRRLLRGKSDTAGRRAICTCGPPAPAGRRRRPDQATRHGRPLVPHPHQRPAGLSRPRRRGRPRHPLAVRRHERRRPRRRLGRQVPGVSHRKRPGPEAPGPEDTRRTGIDTPSTRSAPSFDDLQSRGPAGGRRWTRASRDLFDNKDPGTPPQAGDCISAWPRDIRHWSSRRRPTTSNGGAPPTSKKMSGTA